MTENTEATQEKQTEEKEDIDAILDENSGRFELYGHGQAIMAKQVSKEAPVKITDESVCYGINDSDKGLVIGLTPSDYSAAANLAEKLNQSEVWFGDESATNQATENRYQVVEHDDALYEFGFIPGEDNAPFIIDERRSMIYGILDSNIRRCVCAVSNDGQDSTRDHANEVCNRLNSYEDFLND